MDLKERDALGEQADQNWYFVSKARMITEHFARRPSSVLDVGAGIGWFSRWLLLKDFADRATCVDPGYDAEHSETLPNGKSIDFIRCSTGATADLVLLMDVMEHVDDDVGLFRQYWDAAQPGTMFVVTVPAFQFLWSAHDDFLDHRRRYTLASLRTALGKAGAHPKRMHYYYGAIFPAVAAVRLARKNKPSDRSDLKPTAPILNAALTAICAVERKVMRFNRLAGLSVVAYLEKL